MRNGNPRKKPRDKTVLTRTPKTAIATIAAATPSQSNVRPFVPVFAI
jgi:hypothetical protein